MDAEFSKQKTIRERDTLQAQLNDSRRKVTQLQELVEVLRAEAENLKALEKNHGDTVKDCKEHNEALKKELAILQQTVDTKQYQLGNTKQSCDGYENQLAKVKSKKNDLKAKLKARPSSLQMATSLGSGMTSDQEYINLKFREWSNKMTCATCTEREIEVFLPCGHMQCKECIRKIFSNRQRICPFDRKKISQNDVTLIYWGGQTSNEE
jgi:chromosome segregation ATPase